MSKIEKPKYSLLTEFFITILKIYRDKLNDKFLKYDDKFFIYFIKKDLGVFFYH
jgi:hypothetical protein